MRSGWRVTKEDSQVSTASLDIESWQGADIESWQGTTLMYDRRRTFFLRSTSFQPYDTKNGSEESNSQTRADVKLRVGRARRVSHESGTHDEYYRRRLTDGAISGSLTLLSCFLGFFLFRGRLYHRFPKL